MKNRTRKLERLYQASKIQVKEYMLKDLFDVDNNRNIKVDRDYQRNYIWDYSEASKLIETVVLKAIIPPFIVMEDKNEIIMIDGKQRYKSLFNFYHNHFKLNKNGLSKLRPLAGREYKKLPPNVREIIGEFKIQLLSYRIDDPSVTQEEKEFLQRDIYKRYNYGKTQLKEHEVERAKYLYDELTQEFINFFEQNPNIYQQAINILLTKTRREMSDDRDKISLLMLTIREILVTSYIPILGQKTIKIGTTIVNQYYDVFFAELSKQEQRAAITEFQKILGKLIQIKEKLQADNHDLQDNVLFFKTMYWLLAILYKRGSGEFYQFNTDRLCHYVENGGEVYFESYNNYTRDNIANRYEYIANYLQKELKFNIDNYIEEVKGNVKKVNYEPEEEVSPDRDWNGVQADKQLISYPEKLDISEIIKNIKTDRFIIQPEYQRTEVKNRIKASKMIESIILGVKLPPIYVYNIVPENGLYKDIVLDGQQRLINILSYMGEYITNEKGERIKTYKHGYALTGLEDIYLNNKFYEEGSNSINQFKREPIKNYQFDAIKITARGNEEFDFVDMFVRLNQNTHPLSINSFEMWNAFDVVDVIRRIKKIAEYKLFKQPGKRMQEAELVTILAYMDYTNVTMKNLEGTLSVSLKTYNKTKRNEITQVKLSLYNKKGAITKLLDEMEPNTKEERQFMKSVEAVNDFVDKLKILSGDEDERLLRIFNPNSNRHKLAQNNDFYIMWLILKRLDTHVILTYRKEILNDLENVFGLMKNMPKDKNEKDFMTYVESIISKYSKYCN